MICYISFLILGLPQAVFPEMFSGDWGIVSYSILTLIAMVLGTSFYNAFVSKHVEEYEVLMYLKEKKQVINMRTPRIVFILRYSRMKHIKNESKAKDARTSTTF